MLDVVREHDHLLLRGGIRPELDREPSQRPGPLRRGVGQATNPNGCSWADGMAFGTRTFQRDPS